MSDTHAYVGESFAMGDATYRPFVATDGQVGYMVTSEGKPSRLFYLNPSHSDLHCPEDVPNVFFYVEDGTLDDELALCETDCYVNVWGVF